MVKLQLFPHFITNAEVIWFQIAHFWQVVVAMQVEYIKCNALHL